MDIFNIQELAAEPFGDSYTKHMFTGEDFQFNYVVIKAGAVFEPGCHDNDEYCYCVSGSLIKGDDKTTKEMKVGDISFIPSRQYHWCRNEGVEDCVLLTLMKRGSTWENIG